LPDVAAQEAGHFVTSTTVRRRAMSDLEGCWRRFRSLTGSANCLSRFSSCSPPMVQASLFDLGRRTCVVASSRETGDQQRQDKKIASKVPAPPMEASGAPNSCRRDAINGYVDELNHDQSFATVPHAKANLSNLAQVICGAMTSYQSPQGGGSCIGTRRFPWRRASRCFHLPCEATNKGRIP
jgi:hypothetical protein